MHAKNFFLIKYDELIPIFKELDSILNKQAFFDSSRKFYELINNSKQIALFEDRLAGFEEGSIFAPSEDYSKELETEILRPITRRQIMCFRNVINILLDDTGYYSNRETQFEHDILSELIDCIMDYDRCYKKKYISYSEFLLFSELISILTSKFSKN